MTIDDVRALLLVKCREAGSQKAWATANGVSATYVNDVLQGHREPGDAILTALGLRRIVTYEAVAGATEKQAPSLSCPAQA